jgi:CubicO group peptidase (beta-lactamase class C family)
LKLASSPKIPIQGLQKDLFDPSSTVLKSMLYEKATTLLKNENNLIPLKHLDLMKIASLSIGTGTKTTFQKRIDSYLKGPYYVASKEISENRKNELVEKLSSKDIVIISLHDMSKYAQKDFGITASTRELINDISQNSKVILVLFGSPYSAKFFEHGPTALICAYQEEDIVQDIVGQQIFGALSFHGRLPITTSKSLPFNKGILTQNLMRLGFAIPEQVGLKADSLENMNEIVDQMIKDQAAPGCQILVVKDGRIVFDRAYGNHEYNAKKKTSRNHLYDLASITKVAATTVAIMKLVSDQKIDIKSRLDTYLPELENTNKGAITIEEAMAHHGGFIGWIPFYKETMTGSFRSPRPDPELYRNIRSGSFDVEVANKLYLKSSYQDTIWQRIYNSDLRSTRGYRYSDLGFYLLSKLVEKVSGKTLDQYCEENFYRPMNLSRIGFNPYKSFPLAEIVPTENDTYFRRQKIQGYVHDMGAAMLGGVSGHAGLFSNAYDLAALMQMVLNEGYYGGTQYIDSDIISKFTTRYIYSSRRGIGFDMKELDASKTMNVSEKASILLYGHTGFTGTCAWVDPLNKLIFIFLSNRTFPNMNNNKLYKDNYRLRLQSVVYEAIL